MVFIVYWSQPRVSHFRHNTGGALSMNLLVFRRKNLCTSRRKLCVILVRFAWGKKMESILLKMEFYFTPWRVGSVLLGEENGIHFAQNGILFYSLEGGVKQNSVSGVKFPDGVVNRNALMRKTTEYLGVSN